MWEGLEHVVLPRADGIRTFLAFELPASCADWRWSTSSTDLEGKRVPPIKDFLERHLQHTATVHGCGHGLIAQKGSEKGLPVRKVWRIDTNSLRLAVALHPPDGRHAHERRTSWSIYRCKRDIGVNHAKCAGRVTRASQHYPEEFARTVYVAWCQEVADRYTHVIHPSMPAVSRHLRNRGAPMTSITISVSKGELRRSADRSGPKGRCCRKCSTKVLTPILLCRVRRCLELSLIHTCFRRRAAMGFHALPDDQVRGRLRFLNAMYGYDEVRLRGSVIASTIIWSMAADRNVQEDTLLGYCQQLLVNARHAVTNCGNSYTEMGINSGEPIATTQVASMLKTYVCNIHPDKVDRNLNIEERRVLGEHSKRIGVFREFFPDDVTRFFYDGACNVYDAHGVKWEKVSCPVSWRQARPRMTRELTDTEKALQWSGPPGAGASSASAGVASDMPPPPPPPTATRRSGQTPPPPPSPRGTVASEVRGTSRRRPLTPPLDPARKSPRKDRRGGASGTRIPPGATAHDAARPNLANQSKSRPSIPPPRISTSGSGSACVSAGSDDSGPTFAGPGGGGTSPADPNLRRRDAPTTGWRIWAQNVGFTEHAWTLPYWVKYSFDKVGSWYDDYIAGISEEFPHPQPGVRKRVRDTADEMMGRLRWVEQFTLAVMALTDKAQNYHLGQNILGCGLCSILYAKRPSAFQSLLDFVDWLCSCKEIRHSVHGASVCL